MAITGRPRPLPECKGCGDPVRRNTWFENDGKCGRCATPADRMRDQHKRARRLRLASGETTKQRTTDDRIAALSAKRAARASGDPLASGRRQDA